MGIIAQTNGQILEADKKLMAPFPRHLAWDLLHSPVLTPIKGTSLTRARQVQKLTSSGGALAPSSVGSLARACQTPAAK